MFCWKNVGSGEGEGEPVGFAVGVASAEGAGVAPVVAKNGTATSVALRPLAQLTPLPVPSATRYFKSVENATDRTSVIVERVPLQFVNVGW